MTESTDEPEKLTRLQMVFVAAIVLALVIVMFGSLIGAAWYLPSPWFLAGAVPATATYWLLQRDSTMETLVIFLILLFVAWIIRPPVQHFREYLYPTQHAVVVTVPLFESCPRSS
jgi:hypothetical protein